jgi:ribose transport system substrate-binding protein
VEVGNWEETKAQSITRAWIARFGNQLNGIMASNDGMAHGAVAALKAQGLNGKIFVTGADGSLDGLNGVKSGDMLITMWNDPIAQGALTMYMAYAASIGDIDPAKLSQKQRDFYMGEAVVNASNVDKYLAMKKANQKYTYAYMKAHWNEFIDVQIPPNANDPKQDQ